MAENLVVVIASFYIYSFLGWIWESLVLPLSRKQVPYNRGFLSGPWIPIYGFGAMLMVLMFDIKQIDYPLHMLFLSGGVMACLLEYITSYFMEKIFHHRWWDYSQKRFNINGRVCLEGFICFGLFSLVEIRYIQPFFTKWLLKMNNDLLLTVCFVLSVLFVIDSIMSGYVALGIEHKLNELRVILDEKEEKIVNELKKRYAHNFEKLNKQGMEFRRQQLILKVLLEKEHVLKYHHRRLIKAFPQIIKRWRDK